MIFFRLEGDNANKVQKGQTLIVKADVSGALPRVETCEILEISPEATDFLATTNELGLESFQLKGLYMLIKNQNFNIVIPDDSIIELGNRIKRAEEKYRTAESNLHRFKPRSVSTGKSLNIAIGGWCSE